MRSKALTCLTGVLLWGWFCCCAGAELLDYLPAQSQFAAFLDMTELKVLPAFQEFRQSSSPLNTLIDDAEAKSSVKLENCTQVLFCGDRDFFGALCAVSKDKKELMTLLSANGARCVEKKIGKYEGMTVSLPTSLPEAAQQAVLFKIAPGIWFVTLEQNGKAALAALEKRRKFVLPKPQPIFYLACSTAAFGRDLQNIAALDGFRKSVRNFSLRFRLSGKAKDQAELDLSCRCDDEQSAMMMQYVLPATALVGINALFADDPEFCEQLVRQLRPGVKGNRVTLKLRLSPEMSARAGRILLGKDSAQFPFAAPPEKGSSTPVKNAAPQR